MLNKQTDQTYSSLLNGDRKIWSFGRSEADVMGRKRGQKKFEEMSNIMLAQGRIEYVPPKSEMIWAFARLVCETLAAEKDDPTYLQYDTIHGLAQFLEFVARVLAKRLNTEQLVDKDEK